MSSDTPLSRLRRAFARVVPEVGGPSVATRRVTAHLSLPDGGAAPAGVEAELWDRDLLGPDLLGRGFTDDTGRVDIAYDPIDAGVHERPDLELRIVERSARGREVVATFRGPAGVRELLLDLGGHRLPRAVEPAPPDQRPAARPDLSAGMPRTHPGCLPTPYTKRVLARMFLVGADPAALAAELPPCLRLVPGLESTGLVCVMTYPEAFSTSDPTGATYAFEELVIGAFVHERERPARIGLYPVAIYISTDVAMIAGREMYGFPKKLAAIERGDRRISVTRPGLAPSAPSGPARPIEILRGTWNEGAAAGTVDALVRTLRDRVLALGAQAAAFGMSHLFELPFYNHQVIPAPPTPGGGRPYVSRVWRAPLVQVTVHGSRSLAGGRFELGASRVDPIYRLAPGRELALESTSGLEMDVTFSMNEAEIVADYSAPEPPPRERPADRVSRFVRGVLSR